MKVIAKPIEMIAWFKEDGTPNPCKFRFKDKDNNWKVIKVEQIVDISKERLAGNEMYIIVCQSSFNGELRKYELKFELATCKWLLFKI